jgi:hypothetical protein
MTDTIFNIIMGVFVVGLLFISGIAILYAVALIAAVVDILKENK